MNKLGVIVVLLLGGCVQMPVRTLQSASCPTAPGGWCPETREVARASWTYAQLANNAYPPDSNDPILKVGQGHYRLAPGWVERVRQGNDATGFAYAVFDRFDGSRLAETVIAFRGTEKSARDWMLGNVLGVQNRRGWAVAKGVRRSLDEAGWSGAELSVTGHSLGGGIAQFVSLRNVGGTGAGQRRKVTRSIVFDNSPRYWGPFEPIDDVERLALVERGELLTAIRWLRPKLPGQRSYKLDCNRSANPVTEHRIAVLANCLTWIAAFAEPQACASLRVNPDIGRPETQVSTDRPECPGSELSSPLR
jgi:hypothetical protein